MQSERAARARVWSLSGPFLARAATRARRLIRARAWPQIVAQLSLSSRSRLAGHSAVRQPVGTLTVFAVVSARVKCGSNLATASAVAAAR